MLPSEIWDMVILELDREDLLSLALTSHDYRAAVLQRFSRSVIIDVSEQYGRHWLYGERLVGSNTSSFQKHDKPDQLGTIVEACKRIGLLDTVQSVYLVLDSAQTLTCAQQPDAHAPEYASFIDHIELLLSSKSIKRLHISLFSIPTYLPRGFSRLTSLELDVASDFANPDWDYGQKLTDWQSLAALFAISTLETVIFTSARCWTARSCAGAGTPASSNVKTLIFRDCAPGKVDASFYAPMVNEVIYLILMISAGITIQPKTLRLRLPAGLAQKSGHHVLRLYTRRPGAVR